MRKVAIVGNIAAGKTVVENILKSKGFKVFDTDVMGHEVLIEEQDTIAQAFLGYDILDEGEISRKKLGAIVFDNSELKQRLEQIVHPLIVKKIEKTFVEYEVEDFVFVAIPLLFELKLEYLFDKIIFVQASDEVRLKRLMARNNFSKEEAEKRIDSQMPQEQKIAESDFVVNNKKDEVFLTQQIEKILSQI